MKLKTLITHLVELIEDSTGLSPDIQWKLMSSLLVIFILWSGSQFVFLMVSRQTDDTRVLYRWRKTMTYVSSILGFMIIGRMWFTGIQSLATYLGLLSAGVAVALKDPLVNLAGWVFILWRRPFEVGDRVELGNHIGDVIDQRLFMFTLMEVGNWVHAEQSTGRVINIPNGKVFTDVLANYHKGFQYLWNEIPVLITFESDWEKAEQLLHVIADEHTMDISKTAERNIKKAAKKLMIFYSTLTPTIYTSVEDCGVLLTIRYLCEPRKRRGSSQEIWKAILTEFEKHDDIDFAYPTQRIYLNPTEGKPGTWPEPPAKSKAKTKKG